jgi:hypothetical protein
MDYFSSNGFEESERRDIAFQLVNALREVVSISKKLNQPISYEQTLDLIEDLNPEIYKSVSVLLDRKNESDWVKYYKELADAQSIDGKEINPVDLIQKDLDDLSKVALNKDNKRFLNKRIKDYKNAIEYFQPRKISEHKILNRDVYIAERKDLKIRNKIYEKEEFVDYKLDNHNILRLRLLHPDNAENILGADLIYEHLDTKSGHVRFLHMQYKTWNNKSLNFKAGSLDAQIDKMDKHLCKSGFCNNEDGNKKLKNYRMPYCCAFLRPTSKLQNSDSKMVSTGLHIPVCEVKKIMETEKSLNKDNIQGKNVSYKIFDELFNARMIGSRWLTYEEHTKFYEERKLLEIDNIIRLHAQEIIT